MKWQYYLVVIKHYIDQVEDIEVIFNGLGNQGYELVSVENGYAYFKRPKPDVSLHKLSDNEKEVVAEYFGGKVG